MKIGEVAERIGLSLRTLRYYEEVGLVAPFARSSGGFRLYSEDEVARLRILKGMKPFGLTLEEIRDLMNLLDRADGEAADQAAREELRARLSEYADRAQARIVQLEAHAAEVGRLRAQIEVRVERLAP